MITCPNKALKPWKNLVKAVGEPTAYLLWNEYKGEVPNSFYTNKVDIKKETSVDFIFKSVEKLLTPKSKEIWNKGIKNNWGINKTLTELGVPKEQKALLENIYNNLVFLGKDDKDKDLFIKPTLEEVISTFLSNYSYTIEINTAKKIQSEEDYIAEGGETGKEYLTDYYSSLTVPGGTNYTENEIATPAITPSIKGHAQFATDKGIGWFRSDEQRIGGMSFEEVDAVTSQVIKTTHTGEPTKTRRILELQSDLFQKWRNNFEFEGNKYTAKKDDKNVWHYYKNGNEINNSQYTKVWETFLETYLDNADAFTKLLQKDNNWVTFFIKSIIQDSVKQGYEKVLFPSGNTASKIEGHTTLEEFKRQKEARIKELEEKQKLYKGNIITIEDIPETKFQDKNYEYHRVFIKNKNNKWVVETVNNDPEPGDDDAYHYTSMEGKDDKVLEAYLGSNTDINIINNELKQLKQELERVETEGFGALKPIWNFYENTVTNILKKQGYNPVLITDEYGNTWNELDIKQIQTKQSLAVQLAIEDSQAVAYYDNNGKIILKPDYTPTTEILIHEFSHPFVDRIAEDNPLVFKQLLKEINSTKEGKEIFKYVEENYGSKDSITKRKEVLVRAISMVGKGYIEEKTGNPLVEAVKKFLELVKSMINRRLNEKMKTKDIIYATDLDLQTTVKEIAELITMYEGKISTSKTERLDNPEFNKLPKEIQDKLLPRIMEGRLVEIVDNGVQSYYSILGKSFQRQSDYNKNIKEFNPEEDNFKDSVTNLNNATVVGNYIDTISREFFKNPNLTFKESLNFLKDPQYKGLLNPTAFNALISQLKTIKESLLKIHGKNSSFLTEEFFLWKYGEVEGFDGVAGKTDLIVIDENFLFHVYDIKNKIVKESAEEAKNKIKKRFRENEPSDIEKWSKQQETYSEMFKNNVGIPFSSKNVIVFPVTYTRENFTGESLEDVKNFKPVPTLKENKIVQDNAFILPTLKVDIKLPEQQVISKAPLVVNNNIKTNIEENTDEASEDFISSGLPSNFWQQAVEKTTKETVKTSDINSNPTVVKEEAVGSKLDLAYKIMEIKNKRKNEVLTLNPENKAIFDTESFKEWAKENAAKDYTSTLVELIENYKKCH